MLQFFLILLVTLGKSEEGKCPDKWTKYNGHCYMIGNVLGEESKPRTWHQAKAACELFGAHLAVIDDEDENTFVNNGLVPKARPWIGLFDKTENSDWIWVDGQMLQGKRDNVDIFSKLSD